MVYCCVPFCSSKSGKSKGISFHDFPSDSLFKQKWLIVISRKNFMPNTNSFTEGVCSLHFKESDYRPGLKIRRLKPHSVPSIFPGYPPSYKIPNVLPPRKIPKRKKVNTSIIKENGTQEIKERPLLEQWRRVIPRKDRILQSIDKVCELHFDEECIERESRTKMPDGSEFILKRERPRLKPGSVPTKFPNLPACYSKTTPKRKAPARHYGKAASKKNSEVSLNAISDVGLDAISDASLDAISAVSLNEISEVSFTEVVEDASKCEILENNITFTDIADKISDIEMPDKWWLKFSKEMEYLIFIKFTEDILYDRHFVIYKDFSVKVFLRNIELAWTNKIESLESISAILQQVDKLVISKDSDTCLKIVDKDIDLKSLSFGEEVDEGIEDEDVPVVAEIIDDRPEEVKVKELYQSSRWKKLNPIESSPWHFNLAQESSFDRNFIKRHDSDDDGDISSLQGLKQIKKEKDSDDDANASSMLGLKQIKRERNSDSDFSPPRIRKEGECDSSAPNLQTTNKRSSQLKNPSRRHDSDSDISPPHHQGSSNKETAKMRNSSRHLSGSDVSSTRHQTPNKQRSQQKTSARYDSDSDMSPPRHQSVNKNSGQMSTLSKRHDSDNSSKYESRNLSGSKRQKNQNSDNDLSPPRSSSELSFHKDKDKKLKKTLSGLKAGLQNSESLQKEVEEFRKRERSALESLDDEISGRNAGTIIRDRRTGLKRDDAQDLEAKEEENKKAKAYKEKYDKWGKGTEQTQDKIEKFKDDAYEMSKPLARYKDDEDLDERLKSMLHDEDPMLNYIKKKKQKNTPSLPVYSGPPAPPNRFGILPGYRWDGVDRSNGFEKKYFEKINNTRAVQEEAYLWSVQDM